MPYNDWSSYSREDDKAKGKGKSWTNNLPPPPPMARSRTDLVREWIVINHQPSNDLLILDEAGD